MVNVVPCTRTGTIDYDEIKSKLGEIIGTSIPVSIHEVDEIPSEKNGKFRFVRRSS